jgi:hypothetical protein
MSRLSVPAYVEFHQHSNRTFDPYMPIVIIGALTGGVALAVMDGVHSIPGELALAGAVCYAVVIMCPDQQTNRVLVYSQPPVRVGTNVCAMDSVSCH